MSNKEFVLIMSLALIFGGFLITLLVKEQNEQNERIIIQHEEEYNKYIHNLPECIKAIGIEKCSSIKNISCRSIWGCEKDETIESDLAFGECTMHLGTEKCLNIRWHQHGRSKPRE